MGLQRIFGLFVLGYVLALCGCGAPVITAEDVVVAPGQSGHFLASVDRQFGKASVAGADVEFLVDGKRVGSTRTDANGVATLQADLEGSPSSYLVRASIGNENAEARGRIFQWNSGRTAVAVDVDDTISATDYGSLFLTDVDTTSAPLPYSPSALRSMAEHYEIVYLSARPRWLHQKTKLWLEAHGFPSGPILHAARFEACFRQEYYKRELIAEFQRKYPNLLIGIGDKSVDDRAYGDNRMLGVILEKSPAGYDEHCVIVPDWRSVEGFFDEHRDSLADVGQLQRMIHSNGGKLRTYFEPVPQEAAAAGGQEPVVAAASPGQRSDGPTKRSPDPSRPVARGDWIYGYK